jgi:SAM-dependent MidA family methyltransferase
VSGLKDEIRALVEIEGPISVARYMAMCLGHPRFGYYMTRDPFGAAGDFVTAPEISQMFGELVGLWAAGMWQAMGAPPGFRLIELGAGRGTLMADALRAARVLPGFREALTVEIVEISPVLRAAQEKALAGVGVEVAWHADLGEVGAGPFVLIANEFLDALPIRQFVRVAGGWRERLVGPGDDGALTFGVARGETRLPVGTAPEGAVFETCPDALALAGEIGRRLSQAPGAALLVDYGHVRPGFGDTLQAVRGHAFADPLAEPGEADLTAHVDFSSFLAAARLAGAATHGPVAQGDFLRRLGLAQRAAALSARTDPAGRGAIAAAVERLAGDGPGAMGRLFKAAALTSAGLVDPPGFDA